MEKHTFYIQTPPGLEKISAQELCLKWSNISIDTPAPYVEVSHGAIIIETSMDFGLSLNYWLKIPNRILVRFAQFKCRDLPKLFKKVSNLNLSSYFAGQDYQFHISSVESRLFDSRKIESTLRSALNKNLIAQAPKKKAQQRVCSFKQWSFFCRFENDWCTLSIDTTGNRLGLRGSKTHVGRAPLRENLAAAMYYQLFQKLHLDFSDIENQKITIIDPFAGSGTLLNEALEFFNPNTTREFAFEYFPKTLKSVKATSFHLTNPFHYIACEIEESQYNALKSNLIESVDHYQSDSLCIETWNKKLISNDTPLCVLSNPPYGKRISSQKSLKDLLDFYYQIEQIKYVLIVMPKDHIKEHPQFKLINKLNFSNGGTKVVSTLWGR